MIDFKSPAELRELLEKVTPGPWEAVNHYETDDSEVTAAIVECESQRMVAEVGPSFEGYEDAQFLALSREALPYWIKRCLLALALLRRWQQYDAMPFDPEDLSRKSEEHAELKAEIGAFLGGKETPHA